jgi:hypothetical protein
MSHPAASGIFADYIFMRAKNTPKELAGMKNMQKVAGIILTMAWLIMAGCGVSETPQEKFQKKVSHEMAEMQKKIENLKNSYNEKLVEMHKKFSEEAAAAQKKYNEAMADLSKKQEEAKKEMAGLKSATGEAWEKTKEKMDKITEDLEKTYEKAKSEFK